MTTTSEIVQRKSAIWRRLNGARSPLDPWRNACALWCARWFWPAQDERRTRRGPPPSDAELAAAIDAVLRATRRFGARDLERWISIARTQSVAARDVSLAARVRRCVLRRDGQPRARPGFDAVIGNPPWEMLRDEADGPSTRGHAGPSGGDGPLRAGVRPVSGLRPRTRQSLSAVPRAGARRWCARAVASASCCRGVSRLTTAPQRCGGGCSATMRSTRSWVWTTAPDCFPFIAACASWCWSPTRAGRHAKRARDSGCAPPKRSPPCPTGTPASMLRRRRFRSVSPAGCCAPSAGQPGASRTSVALPTSSYSNG